MAEFTEVCRQAIRWAKSRERDSVERVAIYISLTDKSVECSDGKMALTPKEAEAKIMEWAAKNPEPKYPTWKQWWEDNFPDASEAFPPCRGYFMDLGDRRKECRISCEKCKNQPIPADIAEKLGIKPIEVSDA